MIFRTVNLQAFLFFTLMLGSLLAAEPGDRIRFQDANGVQEGVVVKVLEEGKLLIVETTISGKTKSIPLWTHLVQSVDETKTPPRKTLPSFRTWTDRTGKFQIEATFVSQNQSNVVLKDKSDRLVKISIKRLSRHDRDYVTSLKQLKIDIEQNKFLRNQLASNEKGVPNDPGHLTIPPSKTFPHHARTFEANPGLPKSVEPDPSLVRLSHVKDLSVNVSSSHPRGKVGQPVILSPAGDHFAYSYKAPPNAENPYTKVCSVKKRRASSTTIPTVTINNTWSELIGADPTSGDALFVVTERDGVKVRSLFVLSGLKTNTPRVAAHWKLFSDESKKLDYVVFWRIMNNNMVVVTTGNLVRAFNYEKGQEVWRLPAPGYNKPAISPGGRYTAVIRGKQCVLVETATGICAGAIPIGPTSMPVVGFSPDGSRLAVANDTLLRIFEIKTGSEEFRHQTQAPFPGSHRSIIWNEKDHLLLPGGLLLNRSHNLVTWNYRIDRQIIESSDARWYGLFALQNANSLKLLRLPHKKALEVKVPSLDSITALREGDPIAIEADVNNYDITHKELREWVGEAVAKAGYQIDASASTRIIASISKGKTNTRRYFSFGFGAGGMETVHFTPVISRIAIMRKGKTLWKHVHHSSMPMHTSGGTSLQELAKQQEQPKPSVFRKMRLPSPMLKREYRHGLGSSHVSAMGIQDL